MQLWAFPAMQCAHEWWHSEKDRRSKQSELSKQGKTEVILDVASTKGMCGLNPTILIGPKTVEHHQAIGEHQ